MPFSGSLPSDDTGMGSICPGRTYDGIWNLRTQRVRPDGRAYTQMTPPRSPYIHPKSMTGKISGDCRRVRVFGRRITARGAQRSGTVVCFFLPRPFAVHRGRSGWIPRNTARRSRVRRKPVHRRHDVADRLDEFLQPVRLLQKPFTGFSARVDGVEGAGEEHGDVRLDLAKRFAHSLA